MMTPYHFYLSCTFFTYFQLLLVTTTAKINRSSTARNNKVWAPKRERFGNKWPIPFEQNADTLPAIEVRLDPPSDPLPQVTASITLLERSRMRMEESLLGKLEDEFNIQLDSAQSMIDSAVDAAVRIFDNPDIIKAAVRSALLPITDSTKAIAIAQGGSFSTRNNEIMPTFLEKLTKSNSDNHKRNVLIDKNLESSFLELTSDTTNMIQNRLSESAATENPTVQIQVDNIKEPDKKIKSKMDEIEQKRADEEAMMFEQAIGEFEQLKIMTIRVLETNIQIQMNPFLVDVTQVANAVQTELSGTRKGSKFRFREIYEIKKPNITELVEAPNYRLPNENNKESGLSFVQLAEKEEVEAGQSTKKQLNVRVGQSEIWYPTIDELFSQSQSKRDATEDLERLKILSLQLKFIKAMNEMIKEKLRVSVARIIAQIAPLVDTIKTEIGIQELSKPY